MNFRNIGNFIKNLTFRTPKGKAPTIDISNPKNAEETRLLGRANELLDRVHLAAEQMKEMDNKAPDLNPESGHVAVDGKNLMGKNTNSSGVVEFDLETGDVQHLDVESVKRVAIELHSDRNYDRILLSRATVKKDGHLVRYQISDEVKDVLNRDYDILINTRDNTLVFEQQKTDHVWVGEELTYGLS